MQTSAMRWFVFLLLLGAGSVGAHYPRLYLVHEYACSVGTCFYPNPLTVVAGDSVMFTIATDPLVDAYGDDVEGFVPLTGPHNVVADDGSFRCAMGCDGEGGDGAPSASFWWFTRTFNSPGVVKYHDETSGAEGVITILPLPTAPEALAIEYYDQADDSYFVTAFADEIALLDAGAFDYAWRRTGETFNVWTDASGGGLPACRFVSTAFAGKSSHFYTPYPAECAATMANPDWEYEGTAFYLQLPDANGNCSSGAIPLYRVYNNGKGGAPNHRYATGAWVVSYMIQQGWVAEGVGNSSVFACVPAY